MTILSPTEIETDTYSMTGWIHIFNRNIDRLNRLLLKLQALQDIDTTYLQHAAILTWDSVESKWIPRIYEKGVYRWTTTTSTTTTTTTSSTTTTTTV